MLRQGNGASAFKLDGLHVMSGELMSAPLCILCLSLKFSRQSSNLSSQTNSQSCPLDQFVCWDFIAFACRSSACALKCMLKLTLLMFPSSPDLLLTCAFACSDLPEWLFSRFPSWFFGFRPISLSSCFFAYLVYADCSSSTLLACL
jgi:hypothetical protein